MGYGYGDGYGDESTFLYNLVVWLYFNFNWVIWQEFLSASDLQYFQIRGNFV